MQHYDFLTRWRFEECDITEVADILEDTASLPAWWPQLFKSVEIVESGGPHALGQVARCACRARLPYTLHFTYTVTDATYPDGSTLRSTGDLVGTGVWRLAARDRGVDVEYSWRVDLEKPWLRAISPVLRPLLAWNHEWSMSKGEDGLRREIARRRDLR
ncbi:MAG: SRPBCC family protein [Candidatus Eremiobacteraeota bacterium]|nr:SRPBCC family protein [Candidatus Eremiobacteraeota bacterium]MBV8281189.1 SRPBCC family protein [Candidatus Eremiobacteraeota bacterium]